MFDQHLTDRPQTQSAQQGRLGVRDFAQPKSRRFGHGAKKAGKPNGKKTRGETVSIRRRRKARRTKAYQSADARRAIPPPFSSGRREASAKGAEHAKNGIAANDRGMRLLCSFDFRLSCGAPPFGRLSLRRLCEIPIRYCLFLIIHCPWHFVNILSKKCPLLTFDKMCRLRPGRADRELPPAGRGSPFAAAREIARADTESAPT